MLVACISLYFSFMPIHYSIHWMYCYYGLFNMSTMKVTLKLVRRKRKKKSILLCFYHPRWVVVSKCKFVLSQISYASCSVGRVLQSPKSLSLPAYIPSLAFNKKHQAWLRELENSAVIADLKLLNCSTHFALECMTTDCLCLTRQHDLL